MEVSHVADLIDLKRISDDDLLLSPSKHRISGSLFALSPQSSDVKATSDSVLIKTESKNNRKERNATSSPRVYSRESLDLASLEVPVDDETLSLLLTPSRKKITLLDVDDKENELTLNYTPRKQSLEDKLHNRKQHSVVESIFKEIRENKRNHSDMSVTSSNITCLSPPLPNRKKVSPKRTISSTTKNEDITQSYDIQFLSGGSSSQLSSALLNLNHSTAITEPTGEDAIINLKNRLDSLRKQVLESALLPGLDKYSSSLSTTLPASFAALKSENTNPPSKKQATLERNVKLNNSSITVPETPSRKTAIRQVPTSTTKTSKRPTSAEIPSTPRAAKSVTKEPPGSVSRVPVPSSAKKSTTTMVRPVVVKSTSTTLHATLRGKQAEQILSDAPETPNCARTRPVATTSKKYSTLSRIPASASKIKPPSTINSFKTKKATTE